MITSASNQQMKRIRELLNKGKERRKEKCFVAEGIRMVAETPKERLEKMYVSESFFRNPPELRGVDLSEAVVVQDQVFRQISDTQTPQGIMAIVRQSEQSLEDILAQKDMLLLFLENIQDPGNLGTIMRTAEGAGVTGLIMSRDTVDIYNPKTIRATMGSLYRMPFVYVDDFCDTVLQAKKRGVCVYAAHLKGTEYYDRKDYRQSVGFMIGNEGNGLTKEAADCATDYIRIPMSGQLESLNAAVAAAILMYEARRQRNL
ncbi:MAG: TrmH family RNA methyltransferase [Coprococcus sp.]